MNDSTKITDRNNYFSPFTPSRNGNKLTCQHFSSTASLTKNISNNRMKKSEHTLKKDTNNDVTSKTHKRILSKPDSATNIADNQTKGGAHTSAKYINKKDAQKQDNSNSSTSSLDRNIIDISDNVIWKQKLEEMPKLKDFLDQYVLNPIEELCKKNCINLNDIQLELGNIAKAINNNTQKVYGTNIRLTVNNNDLLKSIDNLTAKLKEYDIVLNTNTLDLANLGEILKVVMAKLEKAKKEVKEKTNQINQKEIELNNTKLQLENNIKELDKLKESNNKIKTEAESKIKEKEDKINQLTQEVQNKKEELVKTTEEDEKQKTEIQKLIKEVNEAKLKLAIAKKEGINKNSKIIELEKEVKKTKEELENKTNQMSILKKTMNEKEITIKKQEEELNKTKEGLDNTKKLNTEQENKISTLKKEVDNKETAIKEQNNKLNEKVMEVSKLEKELNQLKKDHKNIKQKAVETKSKLETAEKENSNQKDKIIELEKEVKKTKSQLEKEKKEQENKISTLEKEVEEKKNSIKETEEELNKTKEGLDNTKKLNTEQENKISTLEKELNQLKKKQESTTNGMAAMFLLRSDNTNVPTRKFSVIYFFAWAFSWLFTGCKDYIYRIRMIRSLNERFDTLRENLNPQGNNVNFIENGTSKVTNNYRITEEKAEDIFNTLDVFLPRLEGELFKQYATVYCNMLNLYKHDANGILERLNQPTTLLRRTPVILDIFKQQIKLLNDENTILKDNSGNPPEAGNIPKSMSSARDTEKDSHESMTA